MSDSQFFDLADLNGPLTVEAILQTLQQRFINRQCYVSAFIEYPMPKS